MTNSAIKTLRIIPRDADFLNRKLGTRGEIYFDQSQNTLRLYDGEISGGSALAKADLSNVQNIDFLNKAIAAGVGSGGGNVSVTVSSETPASPSNGNLWLNTNSGKLFVYVNDGDSNQWIQPASPAPDLTGSVNLGDLIIADSTISSVANAEINFTSPVNFESAVTSQGVITAESFETTSAEVPEVYSATNLNLTAGNAVVVTTSVLRLGKFTTSARDLLTAQNGDIIYNTSLEKFQGYQAGAWINLI